MARRPDTVQYDVGKSLGWHMMEWADLTSRVSRDAYLYYFTHEPPGADRQRIVAGGPTTHRIGAHHAAEIGYVFNNMDHRLASVWGDGESHVNRPSEPTRPVDVRLADVMSDYWVAFATTGVPSASGQPPWQPHTRAAGHYMRFGSEPTPSSGLLPGMWRTWSKINAARRDSEAFWYFSNEGLAGPEITDR